MKISKANAIWNGNLAKGTGTMQLGDNGYKGPYTFSSRFENGDGTNPEEMIGAAHAGCFSMAFANALNEEGFDPQEISTKAEVSLEKQNDGFSITEIKLITEGKVVGASKDDFMKIAEDAKKNCPVSKALAGVRIQLDATLKS